MEYKDLLGPAADLLDEAASIADNESLKKYLGFLTKAFRSKTLEEFDKHYLDSHMAWMDLDSRLDATIGPHETYCDPLLGIKAGFAFYVGVNEPEDEEKLKMLTGALPELDKKLPLDEAHIKKREL